MFNDQSRCYLPWVIGDWYLFGRSSLEFGYYVRVVASLSLPRYNTPHMSIRNILLSFMLIASVASAAGADETTDQAVWLLQKAMLVHRDHRESVLLRALRQLKDPRLEPLFTELTQKVSPYLKIHGILGLGEIATPSHIDLALVADIKDTGTQAQLIVAAIDADLLTTADAEQLMKWPGLDPAIGVLVATKLFVDHQKVDPAVLAEAVKSSNDALRGMAAILQVELGQADAMKILDQINASDAANRDDVRRLLLQTIMKYEFKEFAGWAMNIARQQDLDRSVSYQALRAAMMFNVPDAVNLWMQRYDSADSGAERLRLSMLAVDIAEKLDPRVFQSMLNDDMDVIRQIGVVGTALAGGKSLSGPGVAEMVKLLQLNNVLASRWTLQWAVKTAEKDIPLARPLLVAVVQAAEPDEVRSKAWRLESAVIATQKIDELDPDAAPILAALFQRSSILTQEAMLMGLIRSTADHPEKVIAGLDKFASHEANAMALLLRAKHTDKLPPDQLEQLSLIVRGGARLQEPLQIQAAWTYLKLTGQDRVAIATVLGGGTSRTP